MRSLAKARNLRMTNGASSGQTVLTMAKRHVAALLFCAFAAATLAFLQPGPADIAGPVWVSSAENSHAAPSAVLKGARPDWRRVRPGESVTWLSGTWRSGREQESAGPTAFRTSGLFSAELYWNGRIVGRKGRPATDPAEEIPGPIDSAIVIPERLIEEGENVWALKVSSHHAGYETSSAIQEIAIEPYRGTGRGLAYYLPALLLFGGIAACAIVSFSRYLAGRDRRSAAMAASAILLGGAMAAEVSRAVVNYSYDWHLYRQMATLVLISGHLAFVIAAMLANGAKILPAAGGIAAAAACGSVLALLLVTGFDQKIGWIAGLGYCAIFAFSQMRGHSSAAPVAMGIIALAGLAFAAVNRADFLNAGVYGFGLAFLAAMLKQKREEPRSTTAPAVLIVANGSEEHVVHWTQVRTMRAFGNFTEVTLRSGAVLRDGRGLGRLLGIAPPEFLRAHKSFAVNLDCASGVETVRRGSYRLLLTDGTRIPLSRAMRAAVREAIVERTDAGANLHMRGGSA